jgi:hypothetical protein
MVVVPDARDIACQASQALALPCSWCSVGGSLLQSLTTSDPGRVYPRRFKATQPRVNFPALVEVRPRARRPLAFSGLPPFSTGLGLVFVEHQPAIPLSLGQTSTWRRITGYFRGMADLSTKRASSATSEYQYRDISGPSRRQLTPPATSIHGTS